MLAASELNQITVATIDHLARHGFVVVDMHVESHGHMITIFVKCRFGTLAETREYAGLFRFESWVDRRDIDGRMMAMVDGIAAARRTATASAPHSRNG